MLLLLIIFGYNKLLDSSSLMPSEVTSGKTEFWLTFLGVQFMLHYMGVTQVSDARSWEVDVINSSVPVFVDFWAEWCGPCRMVSPVVEDLAGEYEGKVKFVKVNVDEAGELASRYNVFSIPTLILFNNGQVVSQQVGAASKESYQNMINRALV